MGGGVLEPETGVREGENLGDRRFDVRLLPRRTGDDDGDLAESLSGKTLGELPQRTSRDLLMDLRQLPAHACRPVRPESFAHRAQSGAQTPRGLEEDHRARLRLEPTDRRGQLARLARQKALEAEPVRGQPRNGQSRQHGGGPRNHFDVGARTRGERHEPVSGVGNRRHAGVAHDHDSLPLARKVKENGSPTGLVVLVEREDPSTDRDAEPTGEIEEAPGVLGGDDVGPLKLAAQASRRVLVVADRRRSQNYRWSHGHNYFTDPVGTTIPNASDTG